MGNIREFMSQSRKRYLLEDYWLAPDEQILSRRGQQIHLQRKPFQVLTYLVEHRNRIASRAELLDRFWNGKTSTTTHCANVWARSAKRLTISRNSRASSRRAGAL